MVLDECSTFLGDCLFFCLRVNFFMLWIYIWLMLSVGGPISSGKKVIMASAVSLLIVGVRWVHNLRRWLSVFWLRVNFFMLAIYIVDVVGWRHYFLREKVIMAVDDICFCFMSVSRVCGWCCVWIMVCTSGWAHDVLIVSSWGMFMWSLSG